MADGSMQAFNQLIDLLYGAMQRAGASHGRGGGQLSSLANYRGNHTDMLQRAQNGLKDENLQHIDKLSEVLDVTKEQIREAEAVAKRLQNERDAAKAAADAKMAPLFKAAYQDPQAAKDQFDLLSESDHPEALLNELVIQRIKADPAFRKQLGAYAQGNAMAAYAESVDFVKSRLQARGVDINNGGQRIFAREMLADMPILFGAKAGKDFLFENAERKAANAALEAFDPADPELLDLEEDFALALTKSELADADLQKVLGNFEKLHARHKEMSDQKDLQKIAALSANLEAELAAVSAPQQEDEPTLPLFDEQPEQGAVAAAAESGSTNDSVLDLTEDDILENYDKSATVKPSLMGRIAAGVADVRGNLKGRANAFAGAVARKYAEAKNFSFRENPTRERIEPTLGEEPQIDVAQQAKTDRREHLREMLKDPEVRPGQIRAHLDREAEAIIAASNRGSFVDVTLPDGSKKQIPKDMAEFYEEVSAQEAFESQRQQADDKPLTAEAQRAQLVAAEKEAVAGMNRGEFISIEVDGEAVTVRADAASTLRELNDRVGAERESGQPHPIEAEQPAKEEKEKATAFEFGR